MLFKNLYIKKTFAIWLWLTGKLWTKGWDCFAQGHCSWHDRVSVIFLSSFHLSFWLFLFFSVSFFLVHRDIVWLSSRNGSNEEKFDRISWICFGKISNRDWHFQKFCNSAQIILIPNESFKMTFFLVIYQRQKDQYERKEDKNRRYILSAAEILKWL